MDTHYWNGECHLEANSCNSGKTSNLCKSNVFLDEDYESLSGMYSDSTEIEADLQFEIDNEDIEVISMPDTDN